MRTSITLITLFFLTTLSSFVYGQNKIGKVTGTAKSVDGKVLDGATIGLLRAKDKSLAKSAISNKGGEFEIEKIADGEYVISITAVGYAKQTSQPFTINETSSLVQLGTLQLKNADKDLGTVKVTATRPLIENKIDKTIVNVDAAVTNAGSTALEVLEKSPGISVDRDGNISLKGKQGVIILMDGKQTYLSGADLANLLRNMPAGQLDQIEIMSQPSAKFDASGNSGVINIKTKRQTLSGFNGSVSTSYTQGIYPRSSNSFSINSRKGKLNLFANYGYSYFKGFNEISIIRKIRDRNTKVLTDEINQTSFMTFTGQPHSLKLGADLFATKKTTVGVVLNGFYNHRKGNGNSLATIYDGKREVSYYNQALSSNDDPWKNYSVNLNFRHVFDSTGKEITADIDHVGYITKSRQNTDNDSTNTMGISGGNPYLLRGFLPSEIKIYTAKIDFAQPLKGQARFEAGLKTSFVKTDNDARYTNWDKPTSLWLIDGRSNH
ncbi:MAG: outer membrane beta-barrel protein, partial [Segetibacter sp.]